MPLAGKSAYPGSMAEQARTFAVLRTCDDLVKVIRARRDELDVPHEILDEIAGLHGGYTSKLLIGRSMTGSPAFVTPSTD